MLLSNSLKNIAVLINSQADYALNRARVAAKTNDESLIKAAESGLRDAIQAATAATVGQPQSLNDLQSEATSITNSVTGVQVRVTDLAKLFLGKNASKACPRCALRS